VQVALQREGFPAPGTLDFVDISQSADGRSRGRSAVAAKQEAGAIQPGCFSHGWHLLVSAKLFGVHLIDGPRGQYRFRTKKLLLMFGRPTIRSSIAKSENSGA